MTFLGEPEWVLDGSRLFNFWVASRASVEAEGSMEEGWMDASLATGGSTRVSLD
jgi:hypothetical protein